MTSSTDGGISGVVWRSSSAGGEGVFDDDSGASATVVNINALTSLGNTNFDTVTVNSSMFMNAFNASSGAQNDEIYWDVLLAAGTWKLDLFHHKASDRGIYTGTIDGTTLTALGGSGSPIDGYAAVSGPIRSTVTGIVLPSSGVKRLKLAMATKNASASAYKGAISAVTLTKTA